MSEAERREYTAEMIAAMTQMLRDFVPHNRAIGLEVLKVSDGEVWTRVAWAEQLVGNPVNGVLHGGVVSTMMDASCGLAVMTAIGRPTKIATLDLRIDYLRGGRPRRAILARTRCLRVTKHVCFVRGVAYQPEDADALDDDAEPIAVVTATFARKSG